MRVGSDCRLENYYVFRAGKDKLQLSGTTNANCSSPQSLDSDSMSDKGAFSKCLASYSNFLAIIVLMIILVGILMIGFFFRPVLGELLIKVPEYITLMN